MEIRLVASSRFGNGENAFHRLLFAPVMIRVAFEAARLSGFFTGMVTSLAGSNAGEQDVSGLLALRRAGMALETF